MIPDVHHGPQHACLPRHMCPHSCKSCVTHAYIRRKKLPIVFKQLKDVNCIPQPNPSLGSWEGGDQGSHSWSKIWKYHGFGLLDFNSLPLVNKPPRAEHPFW